MDEEWRPVARFVGWYEVSNLGSVRRVGGGCGATWKRVLKPQLKKNGYLSVGLSRGGKTSWELVHRLVCTAFFGPAPDKWQANHRDRDRTNNTVGNLEWVPASENLRHRVMPTRTLNHLSKLTDAAVADIRTTPRSADDMAAKYGVHRCTIFRVRNGTTWK